MTGGTRTRFFYHLHVICIRGFFIPAFLAALLSASGVESAAGESASRFIHQLGNQTIQTLHAADLTHAQRESRFRNMLAERFDLAFIGRFVMGKYWRMATPEQQDTYLALFGEYILQTYSARLEGYASQSMTVLGERQANDKDTVVSIAIAGSSGPAIIANWRVRATADGYRIIDVAVEGISLAITHRSEFSAVVKRHGIEGLLTTLRDHTATTQTTASLY